MNRSLKTAIFVFSLLCLIGCDQATKSIARGNLLNSPTTGPTEGVIQFAYAENEGSFMGLGSDLPFNIRSWLYLAMAVLVSIWFVILLIYIHQIHWGRLFAFTLLLAGASGNLVDRFTHHGRVIDFMIIRIGGLQTGIFNIADILITTGVILLLYAAKSRKAGAS